MSVANQWPELFERPDPGVIFKERRGNSHPLLGDRDESADRPQTVICLGTP